MPKKIIIFFLILMVIVPFSTSAVTEVNYPTIPGATSPQDIVQQAESEKEVFPLFLAYLFNVLLLVSVVVIAGITIYVVSVYAMSSNSPEKKKKAKEWLLNALQGSLIIFTSYTILYALDSRLVLFQSRNLDDTDKPEEISMEWDLKTKYFQIPTGLIIEDAILNDIAKSKFYDILEITEDAERDLDEIIPIGQEIINIIEMCPVGSDCCGGARIGDVQQMAEDFPHHEGGLNSWTEMQEAMEEDPDFFERFSEAWEEVTGNPMTREKIMEKVAMEESGHDLTIEIPPGSRFVSSGVEDNEAFNFTGIIDEEITILRNPSSPPPPPQQRPFTRGRTLTLVGLNPKCGNPIYVIDGEEVDEGGGYTCPPCPEINPPIIQKIMEMQPYLISFSNNLDFLYEAKKPLHEDLYQIYKIVMLQSLGYEHLMNYPTFLFQKRTYDYENMVITTDTEKTSIGGYTWDWGQWLNNIVYNIELNGETITENDPVTFYLKEIYTEQIIKDALEMARAAKDKGFQNIDNAFGSDSLESTKNKDSIFKKIISFLKNIFTPNNRMIVFAESPEEKLQQCIKEKGLNIEELDFFEVLDICEIEYDESDTLLMSKLKDPSDFLSCGMEIPVGETLELTWNHLIEILNTIDEYIENGKLFLERQEHMNSLASQCECPCENDRCPTDCGNCELTCNLGEIIAVYNEILEIRAISEEIANRIRLLTYGHFNTPTENICDPLNEDIRDENEKELCLSGEIKLITNHELITRKLNYSRYAFDKCITLPEDMDDIYEGRKTPKLPVFAPIAEKKNLPRYTKTKEDGEVMNTSDFNWFCCEGL